MPLICRLSVIYHPDSGRYISSTINEKHSYSLQNPKDKSATKRDLNYWIELAKLLERGGVNALFLADTYGGYDTYEGSLDNCIRRAAQWPVTDPTIVSETHPLLRLALTQSSQFQRWLLRPKTLHSALQPLRPSNHLFY